MYLRFTIRNLQGLLAACLSCCFINLAIAAEEFIPPSSNAVIRAPAGPSEIVITTTDRLAGAIHSLRWNGQEFIDSADHGRQLQSAASFDCSLPQKFWAECFNPTEAGSRDDGAGSSSTSRLLQIHVDGAELETTTQMAFWLRPGEKSEGRVALNGKALSDHLVHKRVHIGYKNLPHAIEYDVVFTVPQTERHTLAQFEVLTGYMPPAFSRFWTFHPATGELKPLSGGPGEQEYPVVVSTAEGSHAMGVFFPNPGPKPSAGATVAVDPIKYGRFTFPAQHVNKWNCVSRLRSAAGIPPGDYRFHLFVAVGTLDDVKATLTALVNAFPRS